MKGQLQIYYDEEADFLEIHIGEYDKGYFRDIADGVAERINEKTGEVTGLAIMSFKKRIEKGKNLNLNLPVKIELSS